MWLRPEGSWFSGRRSLVVMGCIINSTVKVKVSEAEERSRNVSSGQALLVTDLHNLSFREIQRGFQEVQLNNKVLFAIVRS